MNFPEIEDVSDTAALTALELLGVKGDTISRTAARVLLEIAYLRGWNAHTRVATAFLLEYQALRARNRTP